ncbi:MAG: cache domain-containing protein [Pseudomonadota bacterium]
MRQCPLFIRIQGISLKWKLLIPFLFFAFTGTTVMVYIGLASQQKLIRGEEKKTILHHYEHFLDEINTKAGQARSFATMISKNPEVQSLLAKRDREALKGLLSSTYESLKKNFDIGYFHFHIPPARSFLRLHSPEKYGEEMSSFRKTIMDSIKTKSPAAGLEWGVMGFGIRGVSPIFHGEQLAGTVEIGHSFGTTFLNGIRKRWGIHLALYEIKNEDAFVPMAKAGEDFKAYFIPDFLSILNLREPTILISPKEYPDRAILFGPVRNYSKKVVALVEISTDRSEIINRLNQTKNLMITVGSIGIGVSFLFTFFVAYLFIKPIKEIVREAQDIAQEKREIQLDPRPGNEIGTLTQALNLMLDSLKKKRLEIENHARNLERIVHERTSDLVSMMENYRTLVENVPLIVYRLLQDGTTELVNSYLTEILGFTIEEAVGDKRFWQERICGNGDDAYELLMKTCFEEGEEFRTERVIDHKNGLQLHFLDHAIPAKDDDGKIKWIDGIMLDISELKRLQEKTLRTEEVRILGEISARMAHEIRNPLATAGGFARRLRDALPDHDPRYRLAQIIVEEVARIENFLKILFSSIRPLALSLTDLDMNELLSSWLRKLEDLAKSKKIEILQDLYPSAPKIQGDYDHLDQAFQNILKHAMVTMPEGETLRVATNPIGDHLVVTLRHKVTHLSDDDLEQFFFPHVEDGGEWNILDLPFSKIIIHRHGGKIGLVREGDKQLVMKIEFPITLGSEEEG